MKRLAIILIGAAFLFCGDDDSTNPGPGGEILPLAIGNTWTYEEVSYDTLGNVEARDTITAVVVRDTVIASETWYLVESEDEEGLHYGYCTNRSDGFWSDWPDERLTYKYPARAGDQYMVDGETYLVESLSEPVTVRAGTFDCVRYRVQINMIPFTVYHRLSPNIGLVSVEAHIQLNGGDTYMAFRLGLLSYSLQ